MKKLFLIGFLLLAAACQPAESTPTFESTPTETIQPTPQPATVAPTFTPTPQPSPTPVPLYFTEEFNSNLGAWTSFQTSGDTSPQVSLENDSLRIDLSSPNTWYYAIHNAHTYANIRVDAKFNSDGGEPISMGLMCMYSEADGWYEFNISSDGTYNVLWGQWLADGIAQYKPLIKERTEYLTPGVRNYEIGLACSDNILWLYINSKLFRKQNVDYIGLMDGEIGISAASFENAPAAAFFEWVKVSEPPQ